MSTAGRADALDGALLLDECQIPLQECERLDESLALALHHLVLPPGWSLLGNRLDSSTGETGASGLKVEVCKNVELRAVISSSHIHRTSVNFCLLFLPSQWLETQRSLSSSL